MAFDHLIGRNKRNEFCAARRLPSEICPLGVTTGTNRISSVDNPHNRAPLETGERTIAKFAASDETSAASHIAT
jgi:hypothetical protein